MFPHLTQPRLFGGIHLAYFGILIPLLVIRSRPKVRALDAPLPDRARHFRTTAWTLIIFGGWSVCVAYLENIDLFPRSWPPWRAVVAGALFYALAVILMKPRWRKAVAQRQRVVHLFMPQTGSERIGWITVSTLAGLTEEITWRGVQFALIGGITGDPRTAALLTSISFGVAHAIQSWTSVVIIVVFALGFHMLVWLASSLYVAMAVHIAYDLTAGFAYGRLGKELGYSVESAASTPADVPKENLSNL